MLARPRGTDNARVIQVIETTALRGEGTEKDTCRQVKQYWDFEGNFLAENDPIEKRKDIKTCELVEELRKREAVETHIAEPYKDLTVTVNGPAIVLVVTD